MAYTPELSLHHSRILRRIAWALEILMTRAMNEVFDYLGQTLDRSKICLCCKDKSLCGTCPFKRKTVAGQQRAVYLIGNPQHPLGFMVVSPDDPLGYTDPVEALCDLGQLRKGRGRHLKLYQVIPVTGSLARKQDLAQHIIRCDIGDFDYTMVQEYL